MPYEQDTHRRSVLNLIRAEDQACLNSMPYEQDTHRRSVLNLIRAENQA